MERNSYALMGTTLVSLVAVSAYVMINNSNKPSCTRSIRPEGCTWVGDEGFKVFSAIADALVPSYTSGEIHSQARASMEAYCPDVLAVLNISMKDLMEHTEFLSRGALDSGSDLIAAISIEGALSPGEKSDLAGFLNLLATSAGCGALTGHFTPFDQLTLQEREVSLAGLRDSVLPVFRSAFQTLKRVVGSVFLTFAAHRGISNVAWEHMKYKPFTVKNTPYNTQNPRYEYVQFPENSTETDPGIHPTLSIGVHPKIAQPTAFQLHQDRVLKGALPASSDDVVVMEADVVVVGSGAGGGMLAAELVKAGLNVVVCEKGGYYTPKDDYAQWSEVEAFARSFEKGGLCATKDANITVLAGSCVGGGTSINWCASFRPPANVQAEWDRSCGGDYFKPGGEFDRALDTVHELMNVNTRFSYREKCCNANGGGCGSERMCCDNVDPNFVVNGNNDLLWDGAKKLGWNPAPVPRNVKKCVDCGHCNNGCSYNAKQSTIGALLEPLANNSATSHLLHVIPHCKIQKILFDDANGHPEKAIGVEGIVSQYNEEDNVGPIVPPPIATQRVRIMAKAVVSSAGSLHSPALLLRSGVNNRKVGKHLTLHPVLGTVGVFPDVETKLYTGVGMGVVVSPRKEDLVVTKPKSIDFVLETPPVHPSILGLTLGWYNGLGWKSCCLNYDHLGCFINIPRDLSQESNCVTIDAQGEPVMHYVITDEDKATLMAAQEAQMRCMRAAGCRMFISLNEKTDWFHQVDDDRAFEEFVRRRVDVGVPLNVG